MSGGISVLVWRGAGLLFHILGAVSGAGCTTRHGFGAPCIIPFRWNGELYQECTTRFPDNTSDAKCPTKLENPVTLEASKNMEDWGTCVIKCNLLNYSTTEELQNKIETYASEFPQLASRFVIGTSVKGRPLMGIRLSNGVQERRSELKPMVRMVANIHGSEPIGRELLVHLAYYLLQSYFKDERIKQLLDSTDISLLPSINPDGYERAEHGSCSGTGRKHGTNNERNVDLNRNFPTLQDWRRFQEDPSFSVYPGREPETLAVMDWSSTNPFVLSANLNGGAVLVSYPYDFKVSERDPSPHLTPDQDLFLHLSSSYVVKHPTMTNLTTCFRHAEGGSVNGAQWLSTNSKGQTQGSLKDFSYIFTNNLEISVDLTCCKFPSRYSILREWEKNKESILSFLEQVHTGVKGIVFGADGQPADNADIVVWNPDGTRRTKNVTSYLTGEYWRLLVPGRSINHGDSTFRVQAFLDDCENTGRRYQSFQQKVLVTEKAPLVVQHLYLRHVGNCGTQEITPSLTPGPRGEINLPRDSSVEEDEYEDTLDSTEDFLDEIFQEEELFPPNIREEAE